MYQSEQTNELAAALAKAQVKMKPAKRNQHGHHKKGYADLDSVLNACREALGEYGLSVHQTIEPWEGGMSMVTILRHSSGQWVKSQMPMLLQKHGPQDVGTVFTYYRRYTLAAIVGVAPGDGLDAEDEAQEEERHHPISKEQVQELWNLIGGNEELSKKVFAFNGIARLEDMPIENYERVVKWLRTLKAKANA